MRPMLEEARPGLAGSVIVLALFLVGAGSEEVKIWIIKDF